MGIVESDPKLVAFCGLYCGSCGRYKRGKCPGCAGNEKASWCQIRVCCLENGYSTCAACAQFDSVRDCRKFDNFMARLFSFVFRSDRPASVARIKAIGVEAYADEMTTSGKMSIRRGEHPQ
ncbi:MAG: DUF3795 domain-containing protein [Anaerolineae bacterium]|nr:DUF3795 domain-containing protein [Anaerolineae bacterium]